MTHATVDSMTDESLELQPGESLVWQGRPSLLSVSGPLEMFVYTAVILGCAGYYILEPAAASRPAGPLPTVVDNVLSSLSILGGAILVFGSWFVIRGLGKVIATRRTVYAVTDRRVLLQDGSWRRRITSIALADIKRIDIERWYGNKGDVTFGTKPRLPNSVVRRRFDVFAADPPEPPGEISFLGIDNAERLEQTVLDLRDNRQRAIP